MLLTFVAADHGAQVRFTAGFGGRRWRHRYKDGTLIDVEFASGDLSIDGRACRVAVFHDVTAQNRATAARVETERELALELSSQNERLREADELKDRFVANVSHELRAPLTAIRGYVEIVLGTEPGPLTEEQERCLQIIDLSCNQLLRVVGDLLLIGTSEAGQLVLEIGEVNPTTLLEECIAVARPAADAKQIELLLAGSGRIPSIAGDPGRLSQAVGNIISNAIKFTEAGQVEVRVHADPGRAVIEIVDTGPGVPASEVDRLFVPFFRASTAARQAVPGAGLGLGIAKEIVEAHGGRISLDTWEGSGTSVRLELPIAAAQ
jgi:signal transduction histidine kinase